MSDKIEPREAMLMWAALGKLLADELGIGREWASLKSVPAGERLNMRCLAIDCESEQTRVGRVGPQRCPDGWVNVIHLSANRSIGDYQESEVWVLR